jgi:excisionase family DNA binding protein
MQTSKGPAVSGSDPPREWVTPIEITHELRTSKSTIYRAIKRGELPAYWVGAQLRIDRADLRAFVKPAGRR